MTGHIPERTIRNVYKYLLSSDLFSRLFSLTLAKKLVVSSCLVFISSLSQADEPVAIVDDIVGDVHEVQIMDLLWEGQSLTLDNGTQISIGYMNTCLSETITGGKVTIGAEKSTIVGGKVETKQLDCGQKIQGKSAGSKTVALTAVFRNPNTPKTPKPDITLYSLYPAVLVSDLSSIGDNKILVLRLDKKNVDTLEVALEKGRIDFHRLDLLLSAGGVYSIALGEEKQVVKISPHAKAQNLSLVQRLVKF
ncbi:MAG: hypothetical protein V7776_12255 [Halopseudomonas aestusnigri]